MLPLKPYLSSYRKYGIIPETREPEVVSTTIQTFVVYALLAPMLRRKPECTALTVRRKTGLFSMHVQGHTNK